MPKLFVLLVTVCCLVPSKEASAAFSYSLSYLKLNNDYSGVNYYYNAALDYRGLTYAMISRNGTVASSGTWEGSNTYYAAIWDSTGTGYNLFDAVYKTITFPGGSTANTEAVGLNNNREAVINTNGNRGIGFAYPTPGNPAQWSVRFMGFIPRTGFIRYNDWSDLNDRDEFVTADAMYSDGYYAQASKVQQATWVHLDFMPRRINNNGLIVGRQGNASIYATVSNGVASEKVVPIPSGYEYLQLQDVNDSGLIVGNTGVGTGTSAQYRPITFTESGGVQFLPLLSGFVGGQALAVNAGGDIVGYLVGADGQRQATLWRDGQATLLHDMADAGTLVSFVNATGISDDGYIYVQAAAFEQGYGLILSPIPEPFSTASLVLLSARGLLGRRTRRAA